MSQNSLDRVRIGGLSIRRVTWYMALLEKDWEEQGRPKPLPRERERLREPYSAPSIPDPWDVERAARGDAQATPEFRIPRKLPEAESPTPPTQRDAGAVREEPWGDEPVTVAKSHAGMDAPPPKPYSEEEASYWQPPDRQEEDTAPLPWELPDFAQEEEASFRAPTFSSPQDQDDFARAMMYLSSDDDFLVTGVGKKPVVQAQETLPAQNRRPAVETELEPVSERDARLALRPRAAIPIRRVFIVALAALLLIAAGLTVWFLFFLKEDNPVPGAITASVVYVGDENMGCVEDGQAVQLLLEMERQRVETASLLPAVLDKPLRVETQMVDARYLAPQRDMEHAVLDACRILVQATGVYVDGRLVAVARSREDVNQVMEDALEPFRSIAAKNRDIRDLRFSESVEVKPITAMPDAVLDAQALARVLITGEDEAQPVYEVVSGDSLIAIASRNDMTVGQLRYANPPLIGRDLIQVGSTLSLAPPKGLLTVQFTERVTEEIKLPFETLTETSSSMYTTQTEVKQKGEDGLREVIADRTYVAGVLVHDDILEETVVKEPVNRVVVKGTKKVTNASGSSTYLWPAQGKISSTFGTRWGKQHQGLDISASTGTPIYAARDGKVTFSGTNGTYGKLIKIDHGGGVETRYAHCSVLKVSSGTTVKKGQLIALVGSTGNSTGPHLHFEIRVGGEPKNPQSYLPK